MLRARPMLVPALALCVLLVYISSQMILLIRIEGAGKTLLYSGDVRSPDDLHNWLQDGCDLLLMESGHHNPEEVCQHIAQTYPNVKAIHFLHHGRRILHDYDLWLARCRAAFPAVTFANDQEVIEL